MGEFEDRNASLRKGWKSLLNFWARKESGPLGKKIAENEQIANEKFPPDLVPKPPTEDKPPKLTDIGGT